VTNLKNEGITKGVFLVGDVMYDCSIFYANKSKSIEQKVLQTFSITQRSYYLATVHRAENTDNRDRLEQVVKGLNEIGTSECPVILPLHPRTEKNIHQHDLQFKSDVRIIKPVSYLEMVVLEKHAKAILTDSGGVQKEAYFYRVPCVTLRDETEWIETVQSGWNTLAGADSKKIVQQVSAAKKPLSKTEEPSYGKGDAANRICEELLE
ncbi:MAG: UDP-N-acetyl glucosamine 2-epimerase, partial [Planctomycetota bacterium]